MKVTRICCQGCGADLQIHHGPRFVTCNFCGANLEIVRGTTTTHTKLLTKIEQRTARLEGNLRVIELQNDIESLDLAWQRTRESYLQHHKNGAPTEPSLMTCKATGITSFVFAILSLAIFLSNREPVFFLLAAIACTGFGIFQFTMKAGEARAFEDARSRYRHRRGELLTALHWAKQNKQAPSPTAPSRPQKRIASLRKDATSPDPPAAEAPPPPADPPPESPAQPERAPIPLRDPRVTIPIFDPRNR